MRAKGVAEAYLHGESLESSCVGVIVPIKETFLKLAAAEGLNGTFEELCKDPKMNKIMLDIVKN